MKKIGKVSVSNLRGNRHAGKRSPTNRSQKADVTGGKKRGRLRQIGGALILSVAVILVSSWGMIHIADSTDHDAGAGESIITLGWSNGAYVARSGSANALFDSSDAGQAVQRSIDSLADGGVLFIQAGNYDIRNQISVRSNITITGEGGRTVLRSVGSNQAIFYLANLSHVIISELHFDGNKAIHNDYWANCIIMDLSSNCQIFNCSFVDAFHSGIDISKAGMHSSKNLGNNKIQNNSFINCGYYGVHLLKSNNNTIMGNTAEGAGLYNIYVEESDGNIIAYNNVSRGGETGIFVDVNADHNIVANNRATYNGQYGIRVMNECDGNVLSSNACLFNGGHGIQAHECRETEIMGNDCCFNGMAGISVYSSCNTQIRNNTCNNNSQAFATVWPGIAIEQSSQFTLVCGNMLCDYQNIPTQRFGLREFSLCDDYSVIHDNIASGNLLSPQISIIGPHSLTCNNLEIDRPYQHVPEC